LKKKHAEHNEAVCDFLLASCNFSDWVVTTGFYSALHFVQHEIFPLTENGHTYPDFNTYYRKVLKAKNRRTNKHSATIELVKKHIPKASSYYRWLYDACMNARYTDYQVSVNKAQQARRFLAALRTELKK
jgi:hypothetical protein